MKVLLFSLTYKRPLTRSIPHVPLHQELVNIGIYPHLLRCYLANGKQYVAVDGASSLMLQILIIGCPSLSDKGLYLAPFSFSFLQMMWPIVSNFYADYLAESSDPLKTVHYSFCSLADIDAVAACLEA